ncbi:hypothetical protein JNW88_20720, partial [Micromonospora sp. ATA32]|nr:hypothetical protein [Micromonospora sp. ATA32]
RWPAYRRDQVIVGANGSLTAQHRAGEPAAAAARVRGRADPGRRPTPVAAPADEAELALTLAALAGRELDPAALEAALEAAVPDAPDRPDARSYRELATTVDRLGRELAEAGAKALWYEEMLTSRDDALKRAQRITELLTGSGPARTGMALVGGMKAARRTARVVLRRLRPPS